MKNYLILLCFIFIFWGCQNEDNTVIVPNPPSKDVLISAEMFIDLGDFGSSNSNLITLLNDQFIATKEFALFELERYPKYNPLIQVFDRTGQRLAIWNLPIQENTLNQIEIPALPRQYNGINSVSNEITFEDITVQYQEDFQIEYRAVDPHILGNTLTSSRDVLIPTGAYELNVMDATGQPLSSTKMSDLDIKSINGEQMFLLDLTSGKWLTIEEIEAYVSNNIILCSGKATPGFRKSIDLSMSKYLPNMTFQKDGETIWTGYQTLNKKFSIQLAAESAYQLQFEDECEGTKTVALEGQEEQFITVDYPHQQEFIKYIYCDDVENKIDKIIVQDGDRKSVQSVNEPLILSGCNEDILLEYIQDEEVTLTKRINTEASDHAILVCPDSPEVGFIEIKGKKTEVEVSADEMSSLLSIMGKNIAIGLHDAEVGSNEAKNLKLSFEIDYQETGYLMNCNSDLGCGIDEVIVTAYEENGNKFRSLYFSGNAWMEQKDPRLASYFPIQAYLVIKE